MSSSKSWFVVVLLALLVIVQSVTLYRMDMSINQELANQKQMIENQDESLWLQRTKELFCIEQEGSITWNTRYDQVCDVEPYARNSGGEFDFGDGGDWIIR